MLAFTVLSSGDGPAAMRIGSARARSNLRGSLFDMTATVPATRRPVAARPDNLQSLSDKDRRELARPLTNCESISDMGPRAHNPSVYDRILAAFSRHTAARWSLIMKRPNLVSVSSLTLACLSGAIVYASGGYFFA